MKGELEYKQKLCFLVHIIHFRLQLQMKKNISKLIAQIERSTSSARKDSFKVTSRNANQYVNKILVESEVYNAPSTAEIYVKEEMREFDRGRVNEKTSDLDRSIRTNKMGRHKGIEHQLNLIQKNYNILALQELLASIRAASKEEMSTARDKLIKLENSLCFSLENQDLDPHLVEVLADFLTELTRIINKSHYIY